MCFYVIKSFQYELLFVRRRSSHGDHVCALRKSKKQDSHRCLKELPAVPSAMQKDADHILQQVFCFRHILNVEVKKRAFGRLLFSCLLNEPSEYRILPQHTERILEKFGQYDKAYGDVAVTGGINGMRRALRQKQKFILSESDLSRFVDHMGCGTAAHINNLHVIMSVVRQGNKTGLFHDVDHGHRFHYDIRVNDSTAFGFCKVGKNGTVILDNFLFLFSHVFQVL